MSVGGTVPRFRRREVDLAPDDAGTGVFRCVLGGTESVTMTGCSVDSSASLTISASSGISAGGLAGSGTGAGASCADGARWMVVVAFLPLVRSVAST